MANVFYLAGFIEAWGRGYEKIREAFEKEKLEISVFEEVRGGIIIIDKSGQIYHANYYFGDNTINRDHIKDIMP